MQVAERMTVCVISRFFAASGVDLSGDAGELPIGLRVSVIFESIP
jgi:hypothetical protein